MTGRWRGPALGLAIVAAVATGSVAESEGREPITGPELAIRGEDGALLLRVPLPDGRFSLRYRNSLYMSTAEERYALGSDGALVLLELAADERAVLGEYYGANDVRRDTAGARRWRADPVRPVVLETLNLLATRHGQRTLLVAGRAPVALWRLAGTETPGVSLRIERP